MREREQRGACDVVLVGRRLPDNENLGLGYLQAALHRAGLRSRVEALNAWTDIEPIAARIVRDRPGVVGLSLPDGGSAFLALGLGAWLRRRGYRGHVTAGGPFATLARGWLLERHAWLDSVVRFAGELPLPELCRRVAAGRDAATIPGVTTRDGDGPPAPVTDPLPMELTPERGVLPEVLGHPLAHIAATRGCPGRCAFCGPAALQSMERGEARAGGADETAIRCAGVGGVRRRPVDALCDEMAALWHDRGVRYFYFVDEHLLPHDEAAALDYLDRWRRGLSARGVGPLGIGCMLRGDLLTPAMLDAFQVVGLVRCFVGIELVSAEERRCFGRAGDAHRSAATMAELDRRGVASITNLMLVHPYSTAQTIARGIEFVAALPGGTFETTEMRPYHGTQLCETLHGEGRLEGNPLRWSYRHLDPVAGRFAEILARLRGQALRDYSATYRLHDLALCVALARRLHPAALALRTARATADVTTRLNALRTGALRDALALARDGVGFAGCTALVRSVRTQADTLDAEMERIGADLQRSLRRPVGTFRPMRAAAAHALRFCLAAAPLAAGCYASRAESGDAANDVADVTDVATDVPAESVADLAGDAACTDARIATANDRLILAVETADPCRSLCAYLYDPASVSVSVNWSDPAYCGALTALLEATYGRVRDALAGADLSCVAPPYYCAHHPDQEELSSMEPRVRERCPAAFEAYEDPSGGWWGGEWFSVLFVVGPDGRVTDVRANPALGDGSEFRPEVLACLRGAFDGLTFPCLAGYEVCPEYPIVE